MSDRRRAVVLAYIAFAVTVNLLFNLGLVRGWWG